MKYITKLKMNIKVCYCRNYIFYVCRSRLSLWTLQLRTVLSKMKNSGKFFPKLIFTILEDDWSTVYHKLSTKVPVPCSWKNTGELHVKKAACRDYRMENGKWAWLLHLVPIGIFSWQSCQYSIFRVF